MGVMYDGDRSRAPTTWQATQPGSKTEDTKIVPYRGLRQQRKLALSLRPMRPWMRPMLALQLALQVLHIVVPLSNAGAVPPACAAALGHLCSDAALPVGTSACGSCASSHQHGLKAAGCGPAQVTA